MNNPRIIQKGMLVCRVCVPNDWDDTRVMFWINTTYRTGIKTIWTLAKEKDNLPCYDLGRTVCDKRKGYVHITMVCRPNKQEVENIRNALEL